MPEPSSPGRPRRERSPLAARWAVRLFPRSFRSEHGRDLEHLYADALRDAGRDGLVGVVRFWCRNTPLLVRDAAGEWWERGWAGRTTDGREGSMLTDGLQDLRMAVRGVRRSPGFAALAILTLAAGIATATTIFSVVDSVLLRPLPYPRPSELHQLGVTFGPYEFSALSGPGLTDLRGSTGSFEGIAGIRTEQRVHHTADGPRHVASQAVSQEYFPVLGGTPALGRLLAPEDASPGSEPVAVLSYGAWERWFGSDPAVLGRPISLGDLTPVVVGVAARGFKAPEALAREPIEVWIPLHLAQDDVTDRGSYNLEMIARMRTGVPAEVAQADLDAAASALTEAYPEDNSFDGHALRFWMRGLHGQTVGEVAGTMRLVLAAVGVLLILACVNVSGLFLIRGAERDREISIRHALGAGRGRIARQLLVESTLLAVVGGVCGIALSFGGVAWFQALDPGDIPRADEVAVHLRVLAVAAGASLAAGILVGTVPAVAKPRRLQRAAGRHATAGRRRIALSDAFVVVETSLALLLLTAAGLLGNSFARLTRVDPGFDPGQLLALEMRLDARYEEPATRSAFLAAVLARVEAIPGVERAALTSRPPLTPSGGSWTRLAVEGFEAEEERPFVALTSVSRDLDRVLGTRVVAGRALGPEDEEGAGGVLVNEAFGRRFWPDGDVLGRGVRFGPGGDDAPWLPVVGVLADVRQRALGTDSEPEVYVPFQRLSRNRITLLIRSTVPVVALTPAVRRAVWDVDDQLPLALQEMETKVAASAATPRFQLVLFASFAVLALLLASVGLYATLSYTISRQTREMGVRMAVGARRGDVLSLVLRRGLKLTGVGLVLGLGLASVTVRPLEGLVFGIEPHDPATLAVVTAILAATAAAACAVPALRASRTDPIRALRAD